MSGLQLSKEASAGRRAMFVRRNGAVNSDSAGRRSYDEIGAAFVRSFVRSFVRTPEAARKFLTDAHAMRKSKSFISNSPALVLCLIAIPGNEQPSAPLASPPAARLPALPPACPPFRLLARTTVRPLARRCPSPGKYVQPEQTPPRA